MHECRLTIQKLTRIKRLDVDGFVPRPGVRFVRATVNEGQFSTDPFQVRTSSCGDSCPNDKGSSRPSPAVGRSRFERQLLPKPSICPALTCPAEIRPNFAVQRIARGLKPAASRGASNRSRRAGMKKNSVSSLPNLKAQ
jgi:hypothetical protein